MKIAILKFTLLTYFPIAIFLMLLAYIKNSSKPLVGALVLFAAYAFDILLRNLPILLSSSYQRIGHFNWEGGILSFIWPWFFIYLFEFFTPQEVGLTLANSYKGLISGFLFGAILGGLNVLSGYFFTGLPAEHLVESTAYQLSIPSLSEELLFRGFFLAILVHYLRQVEDTALFSFGWGIVLVSLLFIAVHLISTDKQSGNVIWTRNPEILINATIAAIALAYLRIATGSIWPCVICHSLINGLPFVTSLILKRF